MKTGSVCRTAFLLFVLILFAVPSVLAVGYVPSSAYITGMATASTAPTTTTTRAGGWARIIIKDAKGNTVDTMSINVGSSKTSYVAGLEILVAKVRALQDGTIVRTDLYVGSSDTGLVKTYPSSCDVSGTGSSDYKFPGTTEWCIQAKTSGSGVINSGNELQVVWKPAGKSIEVPLAFSHAIDSGSIKWKGGTYPFSLYFTASGSMPKVGYALRFEKKIDLKSASGKGTVANPEYSYPISINLLGKQLYIVGVGPGQVVMINGDAGTATASTPVSYGKYKIYSDLGYSG